GAKGSKKKRVLDIKNFVVMKKTEANLSSSSSCTTTVASAIGQKGETISNRNDNKMHMDEDDRIRVAFQSITCRTFPGSVFFSSPAPTTTMYSIWGLKTDTAFAIFSWAKPYIICC
ncbi:unnamed protein product, partial [Allacma fusca]